MNYRTPIPAHVRMAASGEKSTPAKGFDVFKEMYGEPYRTGTMWPQTRPKTGEQPEPR